MNAEPTPATAVPAACGVCGKSHPDHNEGCTAPTVADIVALAHRAEFAHRLAKRLLEFPLFPQAGDTSGEHFKALETAFACEIIDAMDAEYTLRAMLS